MSISTTTDVATDTTAPRTATTDTDPTPRIKHVRAGGTWEGALRTSLRVRDFAPFTSGEPAPIGGDDAGPTPMEYVAAALNGCLVVVTETVAGELGVPFTALTVETDATMDTRGFAGTADVRPYFDHVTVTLHLTTSASETQLHTLRTQVERRCPALNLVAGADVEVDVQWLVTPADRAASDGAGPAAGGATPAVTEGGRA